MKPFILLLLLSAVGITTFGQRMEFAFHSNGLIYNDTTISKLRSIADSLQKKFSYPPGRSYYSLRQGEGHYILMQTGDMAAAVADIRQGISYEDFVKKYGSNAKIDSFVLLMENDGKEDYHHQIIARYSDELFDGPIADSYFDIDHHHNGDIVTPSGATAGEQGHWAFNYAPHGYAQELRAFYFLRAPASSRIPDRYARLTDYTDYMIDTATDIYYKDAWEYGPIVSRWPAVGPALALFRQYVERHSLRHTHVDTHWHATDSIVQQYIKDSLSGSLEFQRLLSQAVTEALSLKSFTDDDFEYYTAQYYSSAAALAMRRNRIVMYVDNAPPFDNMNIATLAAESGNWSVFLKAHLYMMGVEYRGRRLNCIKELEAMDIRVSDLLLGMGLQTDHPVKNHPFQYVGNLGRDMAEAADRVGMEKKTLAMIRDRELDDYNRMLMHYLFLNYLFFLPDRESRLAGLQQLEEADKMLPDYLAAKVKTDRPVIERGANGFPVPFPIEFNWQYLGRYRIWENWPVISAVSGK